MPAAIHFYQLALSILSAFWKVLSTFLSHFYLYVFPVSPPVIYNLESLWHVFSLFEYFFTFWCNKMLQAPLEYSLPFGGTVILGNTALSADLLPLTRVLLGRRGNVFTPKAHTWMHHVCVCKQCVLRRKTMSPMKALFQSYLDPV